MDDGDVINAVHVSKRLAGRVVIPSGIDSEVKAVQFVKTVSSTMLVSPVGSKMDVREVFSANVAAFNTITCVADKLIDVRAVQFWNADSPMIVTPEGILSDVRDIHPENTPSAILRSPEGRLSNVRDSQLLNA
jgi:hypothetical protein